MVAALSPIPDEKVRGFLREQGYSSPDYLVTTVYPDVECAKGHLGTGIIVKIEDVHVGVFYCPRCNVVAEY